MTPLNKPIVNLKSVLFVLFIVVSAINVNAQESKHMKNATTTGYAPVNGLKMYYEIYGEGSMPLVLIHGGGSTIETTFGTMLPFLSGYGKLIAVELQAHGRTADRDLSLAPLAPTSGARGRG